MVCPEDGTNSLLIKSPVGWLYLRPLGAVISREGDMMISIYFSIMNALKRELLG